MGFYAQVIVPLLCDFALDRPFVALYRWELLAQSSRRPGYWLRRTRP